MQITPAQAAEFARYARRPETWAIAARRQIAVAKHLFNRSDLRVGDNGVSFDDRSGAHYAAYLQAGFAVENAAKAALVNKDPTVITDRGTIDRTKLGTNGGHGLRGLAEAVLPDIPQEDLTLLEKLQEYVIWAGRYTVPMNAQALFDGDRMNSLRLVPLGERERIFRLVESLLLQAGLK